MIHHSVLFAMWIIGLIALIAFASWLAHRSYRRFLKKVQGPASSALPVLGPETLLDALLEPLEAEHAGKAG